MTIYCANCETEAIRIVDHGDTVTPLCATCAEAYEWGQASPGADVVRMELVVGRVRDIAHDMGASITKDEARYVIARSYNYDDLDDAVVQFVCWELEADRRGQWADLQRDLAMDR